MDYQWQEKGCVFLEFMALLLLISLPLLTKPAAVFNCRKLSAYS